MSDIKEFSLSNFNIDYRNIKIKEYDDSPNINNDIKLKTRCSISENDFDDFKFLFNYKYEINDSNMIGIVYSGGWDSNYLIMKAIDDGKSVVPIIFGNSDNIIRYVNLHILKSIFKDKIHNPISLSRLELYNNMSNEGYGQQSNIHFYLSFIPNEIYHKLSEIQIGYVMTDYACSFQNELKSIYENSCKLQLKKIIPLTYPMIQKRKLDCMTEFKSICDKYNLSLISTTCEVPEIDFFKCKNGLIIQIDECKECGSCHKLSNTIYPPRTLIVTLPFK